MLRRVATLSVICLIATCLASTPAGAQCGTACGPPPGPPPGPPAPPGPEPEPQPVPTPPTINPAIPGVRSTVPIALLDASTQHEFGRAIAQLLQSANPDPVVSQAPDTGLLGVQTVERRQFSFLPFAVRAGSALRRAAGPGFTRDPSTGVATVTTNRGTQVDVMGAPAELRTLLTLFAELGVRGLTIERGHFTLQTADPGLTGIVRLDFELVLGTNVPGPRLLPDGSAQLTYPGGRSQAAFPIFADLPGFLQLLSGQPGVGDVQSSTDGTVRAVVNGRPLRLRPAFTVGATPGETKREIIAESPDTFTFTSTDGRRQRFTIIP